MCVYRKKERKIERKKRKKVKKARFDQTFVTVLKNLIMWFMLLTGTEWPRLVE